MWDSEFFTLNWVLTLAIVCAFSLPSQAEEGKASYFASHALFKQLQGEWEATGSITSGDGTIIALKETWTGSIGESGNLLIKGTREFGDETHTFEWEYLYNPTTELIEGVMRMSTSEDEVRLEVNVSEVDKTITLKSNLSGDGSSLTIVNKVADGKIVGNVKLMGADGTAALSGDVTHEKKGTDSSGEN
jgi:hypothetical protein